MPIKINLPSNFSDTEKELAYFQIAQAHNLIQQYQGTWKANWMLSEFKSDSWTLKTSETRKEDGQWKGIYNINWNISLANGTRLTDPCNKVMLVATKKVVFLLRALPEFGITMTYSFIPVIGDILTIVRWLYLHESFYSPATRGFALIDMKAIRSFMSDYIEGGSAWALRYPHQLVIHFYREALGKSPSKAVLNDLYNLPSQDRITICKWLAQNDFYIQTIQRKKETTYLSRIKIAEIIQRDPAEFTTDKMLAFLRQFEPEILAISSTLLIPSERLRTEYFSHKTRLIKGVADTPLTYTSSIAMVYAWEAIFKLQRHIPESLPIAAGSKFSQLRTFVLAKSTPNEHTPWIPLKTSLAYTNEALRWITLWGRPLINFYIQAIKQFKANNWFPAEHTGYEETARIRENREEWIKKNLPAELTSLKISGWSSCMQKEQPFAALRESPGLTDAIQVLFGAILLLIAIVKPIRWNDLTTLKRGCLFSVINDGYYLDHTIGKRGQENQKNSSARPIPSIAAEAIKLLIDLGDQLKTISGEKNPYALEALFYFAPVNSALHLPRAVGKSFLKSAIERFCDYANLPPDELNRRWYFLTHEGRKSFIITFFWCYKYASIGAVSWMAGHKLWTDTLAYIQANFPGDELPEFEAAYAAEQLWNFEQEDPVEPINVKDLYRAVCTHFGVQEICLIAENDLRNWLNLAFSKKIYVIEPLVITNNRSSQSIEIAFKIQKEKSHG